MTATTTEARDRAGPKQWTGLAVLTLPTLLIALDFTVLHLAVPQLSADLHPSGTQMLWIVDIYGFMIAGLLITMGTLGDRIGRRKLLLSGGTAFAAASVLAAFSTSAEMLIVARAFLGITGATLLPSTLALITNMFTDRGQRRLAIAVWSSAFSVGGVLGPLIGGALLEVFWWGAVFLAAVPVMLLLLVLGPLFVPEFRSHSAGRVDLVSVALAMGSILPVVYGIKEIAAHGLAPVAVLSLAAGLVIGRQFVRRQRHRNNPLVDLTLFANRRFSVSLGAQASSLFVLGAIQFILMQYLQLVLEQSPLEAGLWTLPAMAAGVAGALLVPLLTRALGTTGTLGTGLGVGASALLLVAAGPSSLILTMSGFALLNLALNPTMALTYDLIIGSAPPQRAGTASGIAETGNELGIALGIALTGSLSTMVYRDRVGADTLPEGTPPEVVDVAQSTLGGAIDATAGLPDRVREQVLDVTQSAFVHGMQVTALVLAVLLAAVTIPVAVMLRRADTAADTDDREAGEKAGARRTNH